MNRRYISTLALAFASSVIAFAAHAADVKNIVIVRGAFTDGSGWRKATEILERRGFHVTIVQQPITSLADDVAATKRILDLQDGPSLLVGHSYGGMVITEAGNRPDVAGLVYVAAFQPNKGESLFDLASSKPPAGKKIKETMDGKYLYLDPHAFADDFAADLPEAEANFMARSQVFASKEAFAAKVGDPAWKTKMSWSIIATEDRSIRTSSGKWRSVPASTVTEIKSSHAVFASHPQEVADIIANAAGKVDR